MEDEAVVGPPDPVLDDDDDDDDDGASIVFAAPSLAVVEGPVEARDVDACRGLAVDSN